jgi:chromosome segregation ATPase
MPTKKNGVPKSLLADVNKAKSRLAALEKNQASLLKTKIAAIEKANASLTKELRDHVKNLNEALKRQQETIASLGKMKAAKKEKRKPSEYNLFLKDKMSQGMSMVDAVKAWKEREGGSSSSSSIREPGQSWQSPTQQY